MIWHDGQDPPKTLHVLDRSSAADPPLVVIGRPIQARTQRQGQPSQFPTPRSVIAGNRDLGLVADGESSRTASSSGAAGSCSTHRAGSLDWWFEVVLFAPSFTCTALGADDTTSPWSGGPCKNAQYPSPAISCISTARRDWLNWLSRPTKTVST